MQSLKWTIQQHCSLTLPSPRPSFKAFFNFIWCFSVFMRTLRTYFKWLNWGLIFFSKKVGSRFPGYLNFVSQTWQTMVASLCSTYLNSEIWVISSMFLQFLTTSSLSASISLTSLILEAVISLIFSNDFSRFAISLLASTWLLINDIFFNTASCPSWHSEISTRVAERFLTT